ncbi:hypothetical protein PM082_004382 [Marasmius tenuissimus]|nr:hypothetical protein PM082_004382 [Marasmius tenuissimus]
MSPYRTTNKTDVLSLPDVKFHCVIKTDPLSYTAEDAKMYRKLQSARFRAHHHSRPELPLGSTLAVYKIATTHVPGLHRQPSRISG